MKGITGVKLEGVQLNCVVITGTDIKGCTYQLKELFLDELKPEQLIEFTLPKDAPGYCIGCKQCFLVSEKNCPHFHHVDPIWQAMRQADLIVFAYPVYVLRAPGHVKSLLDHLGVHWFAHRPDPAMFDKTAAIITQSIGAPNRAAQKDVRTSLEWLGVPDIKSIGFGLMEGIIWDEISMEIREKFEKKIRTFARQFQNVTPKRKSLKTGAYFFLGQKLQESTFKKLKLGERPSPDLQHWIDHGWVSKE